MVGVIAHSTHSINAVARIHPVGTIARSTLLILGMIDRGCGFGPFCGDPQKRLNQTTPTALDAQAGL
mgnify:CR=1 FL=1